MKRGKKLIKNKNKEVDKDNNNIIKRMRDKEKLKNNNDIC